MSYGKKDEDSDQVMIKLDRTSVFQDGRRSPNRVGSPLTDYSSTIQLLSYITTEMSYATNETCRSLLYWREVPYKRSHHVVLWYLKAFPEQRPIVAADGLLDTERAFPYC